MLGPSFGVWGPCWLQLGRVMCHMTNMSKSYKKQVFFMFFGGRARRNLSQVGLVGFLFSSWLQVWGLRANLAPSWGSRSQLGSKLGVLGPTWLQVGPKLGPSWAKLGPSWGQVGQVGAKLGASWAKLAPCGFFKIFGESQDRREPPIVAITTHFGR